MNSQINRFRKHACQMGQPIEHPCNLAWSKGYRCAIQPILPILPEPTLPPLFLAWVVHVTQELLNVRGKQVPSFSSTFGEEFRNPSIKRVAYEITKGVGIVLDKTIPTTRKVAVQLANRLEKHGRHGFNNRWIKTPPCQEAIPGCLEICFSIVWIK